MPTFSKQDSFDLCGNSGVVQIEQRKYPMDKIRVVIAEDERGTRDALARLLGLEDDIEVVGTAADGENALRMVRERTPDVLLSDIAMPKMNGIELTQRVKSEVPGVGTGGRVTAPSPNSPKLWGAATAAGKRLDIDPWLVLGHELCGHAWLGDRGEHAPTRVGAVLDHGDAAIGIRSLLAAVGVDHAHGLDPARLGGGVAQGAGG